MSSLEVTVTAAWKNPRRLQSKSNTNFLRGFIELLKLILKGVP